MRTDNSDAPPSTSPITPYAGTSGWSGSEASRERAEREDSNGRTSARQKQVLRMLTDAGTDGLTWKEAANLTGWHHGQVTGPLSILHKVGLICRLTLKRDRCSVYVVPEHVNGRDTASYGRRRATTDGTTPDPTITDMEKELRALRKKIHKVEERIKPQWRSYSYTRDQLLEDLRRDLL